MSNGMCAYLPIRVFADSATALCRVANTHIYRCVDLPRYAFVVGMGHPRKENIAMAEKLLCNYMNITYFWTMIRMYIGRARYSVSNDIYIAALLVNGRPQ